MLSIYGLSLSFVGASILVFISIKSRREILKETSTGQVPHISGERIKEVGFEKAREEELLTMPDIQAAILQSKVAFAGFCFLASGFLLQLINAFLSS